MSAVEKAKAVLKHKRTKLVNITPADYLSIGSTMANLASTGKPGGGLLKGKYYLLVGDSSSGKTWTSLTCLAEAAINRHFDGYDFYYDNNEGGALMDFAYYFGEAMEARVRPPERDEKGVAKYSHTVESFYYHLDDAVKRARRLKKPFIYILDSENGLTSEAQQDKFQEQKKAHEEGKDASGSYGDGKAKYHSQNLPRVIADLEELGCILIIVSQTRDNVTGYGDKKVRSGGRGLKFYATVEIWTSVREKIKARVRGKDRTIGVLVEMRFKKNRHNGRDRVVHVPIYYELGFDDVGSCIDYLIEEKHWKKKAKEDYYWAVDFDFKGTREEVIKHIEANNLEKDMAAICGEVWAEIEAEAKVDRKPRYRSA
jgi:RecA/RadA recombinase